MKRLLIIAAAVLATGMTFAAPGVATAKAPAYQAAGPKGGTGYTTAAMGNDRHVVIYTGNARMKRDVVANYALLRAAELTSEAGFEWFAILSTSVKSIELGSEDDLSTRTGAFIGNTATAGTGAGSDQSAGVGRGDATVPSGPTTGGYGGGDVPPAVLERWKPRKVEQAVLIIQMGKGDNASFPDLTTKPEIFGATATIEEIRATMK
jgi:hypothetical protein